MDIVEDWKSDIKKLQEQFLYKKKMYTILENIFFIWIIMITSLSEVLKFSSTTDTYVQYTSIVSYIIVVSTGVKKYINPEKKSEKFKFGYIEAKTLEDLLESEVNSPSKEMSQFINDLRTNKRKILEKYI